MNVIFILGFKSPGKALEKTVKQPLKTLDFLISEDVRTLCKHYLNLMSKTGSEGLCYLCILIPMLSCINTSLYLLRVPAMARGANIRGLRETAVDIAIVVDHRHVAWSEKDLHRHKSAPIDFLNL